MSHFQDTGIELGRNSLEVLGEVRVFGKHVEYYPVRFVLRSDILLFILAPALFSIFKLSVMYVSHSALGPSGFCIE